MRFRSFDTLFTISLATLFSAFVAGCGEQSGDVGAGNGVTPVAAASHEGHDHDSEKASDDHDGWWCVEHAVPEEECSMCSPKAAEECKAKGDWCEEHNRAESQCFKCDPTRAERYAKLYEAKFGHEPPKATD